MKLSKKILILITALFFVFLIPSIVLYTFYIFNTVDKLEKEFVKLYSTNLKNVISIFDYEISYLRDIAIKIRKRNLSANDLKIYKVNFVVKNGKVVAKDKLDSYLVQKTLNKLKYKREIYGIDNFKGKYLFIYARRFYGNKWIILGRFIDADFLENVQKITNTQIKILPISKSLEKLKYYKRLEFKYLKNVDVYLSKDTDFIHFYVVLNNVNNKPVFSIYTKHNRYIYKAGIQFFTSLIALFLIIVLIFYASMYILIKKIFIEPVENLTIQVGKIAENIEKPVKVRKSGTKELDSLSDAISFLSKSVREYKNALIEEKLLFEKLSFSLPVGIFLLEDNKISYKNPFFIENIGNLSNIDEFLNKVLPIYKGKLKKSIDNLLKNKSLYEELEIKVVIDTKHKDFYVILTKIHYKNKISILGVCLDLTQLKEKEKEIEKLIYTDTLTNLPNRNAFVKKLEELTLLAEIENKKFAVVVFDIDNFKNINDTFGHLFGDDILKSISKRLYTNFKNIDIFISRIGGDEFGIIFFYPDKNGLLSFTENLLKLFDIPIQIKNIPVTLSISIGIALYPEHGKDSYELIKRADLALYRAKKEGKNKYVVFYHNIEQDIKQKLEIETHIKNALKNKELYFVYQPIINLKTKKIIGAEALIRWESKELGFIQPSKFISLAEESDLILEIDSYVLKENIKFIKKLLNNDIKDIKIALNFSAKFFNKGYVYEKINELFKDKSFCNFLEIEITEREIMKNLKESLKILNLLKNMGFHISIDDFGTGYSSLAYLKLYPIDLIKIDISFIRDIPEDRNDMIITKTIINMAHNLGMKTIAEGIETKEQFLFLLDEGCDYGQGYYFSKPVTEDEFIKLVKKGYIDVD